MILNTIVYASLRDRVTEDADFGKKTNRIFKWSSFWSCKQAKLTHLGHRKPARILWTDDAPKTSHCLVRILMQRHNWTIFFFENEQAIVIGPCWTNFCSQKVKSRILVTFGFDRTALRVTQPKLHSMLCALFLKIAFQSQIWCRLATSELWFDTVGLLFVTL